MTFLLKEYLLRFLNSSGSCSQRIVAMDDTVCFLILVCSRACFVKVELAKSCQCLGSFVFVEVVYDSWIFPLRTAHGEDTQGCHLDGSATSTRQLSSTSMNQFNFGPGQVRPPTARARNRKNKNSDLLTFQVPQTWWHDVIVLNVFVKHHYIVNEYLISIQLWICNHCICTLCVCYFSSYLKQNKNNKEFKFNHSVLVLAGKGKLLFLAN